MVPCKENEKAISLAKRVTEQKACNQGQQK
jgi:hypothetical protein